MTRFNMLQQPKSPGYLAAFPARPGHKLVSCDLSSIEPRIITEFSRDPNMWKLYGPDAKPNDVYLFLAANIALFRDEVRKYYDPDNPTAETLALAKKYCKKTRQFAKAVYLACGYGAGIPKVRSMLIAMGFAVTWVEAEIIHHDYWRLYAGIRKFGYQLEDIWGSNGGFFPNISGRPICVPRDLLHDAVNRFAQSSGHDVLLTFIYHTQRLREERGVQMRPYIIDFYDQQVWEVPDVEVERATKAIEDALVCVNEEYDTEVYFGGDVEIADNLGQLKCEDYDLWLVAKKSA